MSSWYQFFFGIYRIFVILLLLLRHARSGTNLIGLDTQTANAYIIQKMIFFSLSPAHASNLHVTLIFFYIGRKLRFYRR